MAGGGGASDPLTADQRDFLFTRLDEHNIPFADSLVEKPFVHADQRHPTAFVFGPTFEQVEANKGINQLAHEGFTPIDPALRQTDLRRPVELRQTDLRRPTELATAAQSGGAPSAEAASFNAAIPFSRPTAFASSFNATGPGSFSRMLAGEAGPTRTAGGVNLGSAATVGAPNIGQHNAPRLNRGAVRDVAPGGLNLAPFMNPFAQDVVNASVSEIERARDRALAASQSQAIASGAFGGSRNAVAEAEINRNFQDNLARTVSGLNFENFNTALGAAERQQGIGLEAATRNQTADLQTGLANLGQAGQFGLTGADLGLRAGLASADALNQRSALQGQLGLQNNQFNASLLNDAAQAQAARDQATNLQNAQGQNQFNFFTSQLMTDAARRNAELRQETSLANQDFAARFGLADLANRQEAARLNAGFGQQTALANLDFAGRFGLADLANRQQTNLFNVGSLNQAHQDNQLAFERALAANQDAINQAHQDNQGTFERALAANQDAQNAANFQNFNIPALDAALRQQQFNQGTAIHQTISRPMGDRFFSEFLREQNLPFRQLDALNGTLFGFSPVGGGGGGSNLGSILGGAGAAAGGTAALLQLLPFIGASDRRLKTDIEPVGEDADGIRWYDFRYIWDEPDVRRRGVMADEVDTKYVSHSPMGYAFVDYGTLQADVNRMQTPGLSNEALDVTI